MIRSFWLPRGHNDDVKALQSLVCRLIGAAGGREGSTIVMNTSLDIHEFEERRYSSRIKHS